MKEIIDTFHPGLFAGKTILVTGGSSGIGLAIAQGFARLGGEVVALGSSQAKLDAESGKPGNEGIRFERVDVRDPKAIRDFAKTLDKLDVLVNGAGIARPNAEFEDDTYMEVIDVNLNSQMRFAMACLPLLKASRGSIINIASMLSYVTDPVVPPTAPARRACWG